MGETPEGWNTMAIRNIKSTIIGLALIVVLASSAWASFHFTVTADPRSSSGTYGKLLVAMKAKIKDQGIFQACLGDIDPPEKLRAKVDQVFGKSAFWIPVVGNHDEMPNAMPWIRDEYDSGHDGRPSIESRVVRGGPAGSSDTTYSFDYRNAHFIMLNEYWNGSAKPGSDTARGGRVEPELLSWIKADLAANKKPLVFVFGHEPAFPAHRHIHDSLDRQPAKRDAFWKLLESKGVAAYFCGHTHFYSKHQQPGGHVWQIDAGSTRNANNNGNTFVDVTVTDSEIRYDVWRDPSDNGKYAIVDTWREPAPK